MAFVFVFSGGCSSGKTTAINKVAQLLGEENVHIVSENIRQYLSGDMTITQLRSNPVKYLELQDKIIYEKATNESIGKDQKKQICLVDRSLIDSKFYLNHYTNKSDFSIDNWKIFTVLCHKVEQLIRHSLENVYDLTFLFKPLNNQSDEDIVNRPEGIEYVSSYEYQRIFEMHRFYMCNYLLVDPNKKDYIKDIVKTIKEIINGN